MKNSAKSHAIRFNLIDVLLILAMVAAACVLVYLITTSNPDMQGETELIYQVEVHRAPEEFRGLIDIGDKVVDTVTLYSIGEVIDVTYADSLYTGENKLDGTLVFSPEPGYLSITLTIRASATPQGNSYLVGGGYSVAVGKLISFRVPDFTGEGYCIIMEEAKTGE